MKLRGHRTSILGASVFSRTESRTLAPPRHTQISDRRWIQMAGRATRPEHYTPPPEWREGPGDPNIKRKWLMHIEDERAGDWKL